VSRLGARLGVAVALAALPLTLMATALGYLAWAGFALLEAEGFGGPAAAAITGVIALALAVILGLSIHLSLRPKAARRSVATLRADGIGSDVAADLGALAAQQIVNTTREHPYGTVGAALAAGLAVGAIPELRKTLTGFLKH